MSVTDAAETNASSNGVWASQSASSWDASTNGANQWLVNSAGDKVCGSWAQAVSGGDQSASAAAAAASATNQISNIPNTKLISSTQSDLVEENGSQINQHIASSQFDDLSDELYSTRWGSSVINHDNSWDLNSPSSANSHPNNGSQAAGGFKPLDQAQLSNLGTELWHNNLRQTREPNNSDLLQSPNSQQPLEQADSQWKKLVAGTHFGGTWGEEEDMSNVWTGIPNSGAAGSQANQLVANQLAANNQTRSTSATSNVFRQNSINCGKANAQLLPNNSNWISDENENWGETIKTGTAEWESAPDISMLNSANSVSTPKSASEVTENWFYPTANKLNPSATIGSAVAGWSATDLADKTAASLAGASVDNGTSLWSNSQGQNKPFFWKEENGKARNSQAISSEQWKKYPLNSGQINNGKSNWNELMGGDSMESRGSVPGTPITTNTGLAWNSDNVDESDWAKNKRKLTKEMIASSSPFRILVEMGFKEEDVENSLRNSNMNLQESIEELRLNTLKETGVEIDRRKQAQNSPISVQQSLPSVNNMLRNISTTKLPNSTNLPSEKLTNLVQQIQLAVQSGHLNAQILNQQLAPTTVNLIHQLLQQIKIMQSLQSGSSKNYFQNSHQGSQCKQKIAFLQKQINIQQALFFKQQPMGNSGRPAGAMLGNNNIGNLASDLNNLQLSQQASQSRLNQWKLPGNYDKDDVAGYQEALTNDFSRAPGPSTKQQAPQQQFVLPNSWTNMSGAGEENWQQNLQAARAKEQQQQLSSSAPQQQQLIPNNNYGEMVSDFNAKQQQLNSNPRAAFYSGVNKEQQMYNWSAANKLVDAGNDANGSSSFGSNTWSFPAQQAQQTAQLPGTSQQNANIWNSAAANSSKPKGPPPGLVQIKDQNHGFLLIRNLNLQIDESILKTLCRQHGSLLFFHLFLNHGIAIVKYASKEDACKAQSALNNCSLGNTTIQVSLASESDVQQCLTNCQQAANPPVTIYNSGDLNSNLSSNLNSNMNSDYLIAANNGPWNSTPSVPNASMWSFSGQAPNNLWNIDQSASALQNLLPDNLLGESN